MNEKAPPPAPAKVPPRWLALALAVCLVGQVVPFHVRVAAGPPDADLEAVHREAFADAVRYRRPLQLASLFNLLLPLPVLGLVLLSGAADRLDRRAARSRRWRWPARLGFAAGLHVLLLLLGMPFTVHRYLLGRGFGLTHLDPGEWLRIFLLQRPVPLVLYAFSALLVYCCMGILGRRWWLGATALAFLVFQAAPEWISRDRPLDPVERLHPLPAGPHREALEAVARRAGVALTYEVVDQSRRSRVVNMYVTGRLGRDYVVLTDTVLQRLSPRAAAAILAHELWHHRHHAATVAVTRTVGALRLLLALYLVHLGFGRRPIGEADRLRAVVWALLVLQALGLALLPAAAAVSRRVERAADRHALALLDDPGALREAILETALANLETYRLPRWVYLISATHPDPAERLAETERFVPPARESPPPYPSRTRRRPRPRCPSVSSS